MAGYVTGSVGWLWRVWQAYVPERATQQEPPTAMAKVSRVVISERFFAYYALDEEAKYKNEKKLTLYQGTEADANSLVYLFNENLILKFDARDQSSKVCVKTYTIELNAQKQQLHYLDVLEEDPHEQGGSITTVEDKQVVIEDYDHHVRCENNVLKEDIPGETKWKKVRVVNYPYVPQVHTKDNLLRKIQDLEEELPDFNPNYVLHNRLGVALFDFPITKLCYTIPLGVFIEKKIVKNSHTIRFGQETNTIFIKAEWDDGRMLISKNETDQHHPLNFDIGILNGEPAVLFTL